MSWQATNWALEQRCGSPGRKLVLLCLANYADRAGRCAPSQASLARETEQGERTVRSHLAGLEAHGVIIRVQRRSETGIDSDAYFLTIPGIEVPAEFAATLRQKLPEPLPAKIAGTLPAESSGTLRQVSTVSPPNLPPHPPLVPPLLKSKEGGVYARDPLPGCESGDSDGLRVEAFPIDWKPCPITLELLRTRGFSVIVPEHWITSFVGHMADRWLRRSQIPGEFLKWAARQKVFDKRNGLKQEQPHPSMPTTLPRKQVHTVCNRSLGSGRRCGHSSIDGDFCDSCKRVLAQGVGR